jgi:hypothetical protein
MPVSSSRSAANAKLSVSKLAASVFSAAVFSVIAGVAPAQSTPAGPNAAKVSAAYQNLPMQFEPNLGQAVPQAKFLARGSGYNILLSPDRATFALYRAAEKPAPGKSLHSQGKDERYLQMQLLGANASAPMSAERPLGSYVNYLTGSDRTQWHTGIATVAQTRVAGIYPGVDLVYYGTQRQLEYDFVVSAGAKVESIRFAMRGAEPVVAANGDLVLRAANAERSEDFRFRKPVLYQEINGQRRAVEGAFTVANGEVGFRTGVYDHGRPLVIDPIISYSSYFGGSGDDQINGSVLNKNNQLYAVGQTKSVDLTGTSGEYEATNAATTSNNNYHDAFVTKFSADGTSILWTTYLGGQSAETFGLAIAVSAADQAYITGVTSATVTGFPITSNAVQPLGCPGGANAQGVTGYGNYTQEISTSCGGEVFVSELSADGKSLLYSTYLGGGSNYQDVGQAIALDTANNIYVAGYANSTGYEYAVSSNLSDQPSWPINQHNVAAFGSSDYPTTANAYMTSFALAKAAAIAAGPDSNGNLGALGYPMGFITEISADGSTLVYSSGIGGANLGSCGNGQCTNVATTIAPGKNGIVYVGGNTSSPTFPTTANAFIPNCAPVSAGANCPLSGWVAAFDTTKSGPASLAFSTYMVGANNGSQIPGGVVNAVATDASGNVVVTGQTSACNFPTTSGTLASAPQTRSDGSCGAQGFVTKLSPAGATIWSTYLEGTAAPGAGTNTAGTSLALDANGDVFVLAATNDASLSVKNSIAGGGADAYLAELSSNAAMLLMGTFLGTGGGISLDNNSLSLDSNLTAYFSGWQGVNPYGGTYLPGTKGAAQNTLKGNVDGFVVKLITQQQPSATALTVSPSGNATPSQTVQLTATVTTSSTITGAVLPTGTVTFLNGSTTIGTGTLNANGVATYSGLLPGGSYSLTAQYGGDTGFNGSTSASSALTVSSANTTSTALTVSPASSAYGAGSTLTATVTAGSTAATSGTVSFAAGSVSLGSAAVNAQGVATLVVKPVVGGYSVVASYAGTYNATSNPTGYAASVSAGVPLTVTKAASSTSLATSAASVGTGASVMLTATVTSGAAGTVTFYSGSTTLGTGAVGTNGTATLTTSFAMANTYSLTATYGGDSNYLGSTSTAVSEAVVVPSFSVTASQASLTIARGATGATTLTFTPVGGYSGAITLACGTLPSKATCTFSPSTVTLAGAVVTDTLTIGTGTVTTSLLTAPQRSGGSGTYSAQILWLPASMLGLLGLARRRKLQIALPKMLLAGILVLSLGAGLGAISGCSSGSSSTPNYTNATPVGSYSVPVTITGPSGSPQTVALTVVVQ